MRGISRRIEQLEQGSRSTAQLVLIEPGVELSLDLDRCADILIESGFAQNGSGITVMDFSVTPRDLTAEELERYLREHGDRICFPKPIPTAGRS